MLDSCGSDHLPTELKINTHRLSSQKISVVDWDAYRSKWDNFQVDGGLQAPGSKEELEALAAHIGRKIIGFREASSKSKEFRFHGNVKLSKETKICIENRRCLLKLRKLWKREGRDDSYLRKLLNSLNKDVKNGIKKDIDSQDTRDSADLLKETDARKRWKAFERICGKTATTSRCILKRPNGTEAWSDQEIADTHADRLADSHSFPLKSYFNDEHRQRIDQKLEDLAEELRPSFRSSGSSASDQITREEIESNLRSTKKDSSPGEDGISYQMITHGGAKLISLLLILFNGILNSGHFPDSWKEVKIKMLAKAGKNKSIPGSYRPITLSSCVGKLFEKSLKSRIKAMMRRLRAENENQAAYKKRRLCQEHTVHLTQTVSQALNERKCVLLFMLDVKGAFDKLWNRGLIYKLHSWGLSTRLLRCVASFMRERSLQVH